MSQAGFVFGNLCDVFWMNTHYFFILLCSMLPTVLQSCCLRVASWLWFWGVSVRDAGGSGVTEDECPIVERGLHSRLNCAANITEDSPWLSFTFGFLFSTDCESETEEWKTNMDSVWCYLKLNIHYFYHTHLADTSKCPRGTITWTATLDYYYIMQCKYVL